MNNYKLTLFGSAVAILLSACTPIRPVVRDGMGNDLPLANQAIAAVTAAAEPGLYEMAWDATPDPDGKTIYFVANSEQGNGLFSVPAQGGDEVAVAIGAPFVEPMGVAVSSDGATIYVADAMATVDGATGAIFAVPAAGGSATPLAGTIGSAVRGLEVKNVEGSDVVYFTGVDASDGQAAVMRVAAAGGEVSILAKGAPLVMPMGVAIADSGTVYVADRNGSGEGWGSVFRIADGKVEQIAEYFRTGPVVGAALTLDQSLLLVSALDASHDSAQVLVISLATGDKLIANKGISQNRGSGGVHRAHNRNFFAWADSQNPGGARRPCCAVYGIELN